ncbi:MAG: hypothetical protein U0W24_09485 [Bacteroidales bacterium]
MKITTLTIMLLISSLSGYAQIDKDQLALDINKADAANTEKLKEFIWKRKSVVSISGEVKLTVLSEFSFDESGKLVSKVIDEQSTVKKKPGIRGNMQKNAAEDKAEYVQKALELSLSYTYMSKGELIDFFSKATLTEKNGIIEATSENVKVKGDKLIIRIESDTKLYLDKTFSSFLGKDPINGEIKYEKFSSGINHGSVTKLNMPSQNMKIDAQNIDYSKRVK